MRHPSEVQLTHDARGHQLTNTGVWTPDSHWIAYDVRPHGGSFSGVTIERVSVPDGQCEVIYHAGDEACVGVVTVAPTLPERYVFIHGPEHPDAQWQYDFHHRRGAIVSADRLARPRLWTRYRSPLHISPGPCAEVPMCMSSARMVHA